MEHRLVMARKLRRPLGKDEVVHHINGIRSDNREENLFVYNAVEHKKEHWELLRELQALKRENERLQSELSEYKRFDLMKLSVDFQATTAVR